MTSTAAAHYGLAPSFTVFGDLRKVWVKERLERERKKKRKRKYYYNEQ
jgi:hypothetical protein